LLTVDDEREEAEERKRSETPWPGGVGKTREEELE
jgi:5,10-methylene-tetrahydrofolate dehydrogenase/methenyl tetrahydrofolate cyclohydrolase